MDEAQKEKISMNKLKKIKNKKRKIRKNDEKRR